MKKLSVLFSFILVSLYSLGQPKVYKTSDQILAMVETSDHYFLLMRNAKSSIWKVNKTTGQDSVVFDKLKWIQAGITDSLGFLFYQYNDSIKLSELFYYSLDGQLINTGIRHSSSSSFLEPIKPANGGNRIFAVAYDKQWKLYEIKSGTGEAKLLFQSPHDPLEVFLISNIPTYCVRNRANQSFEFWLLDSINPIKLHESFYNNFASHGAAVVATTSDAAYVVGAHNFAPRHTRPLIKLTKNGADSVGVFPFKLAKESFTAFKFSMPVPLVEDGSVVVEVTDNYDKLPLVYIDLNTFKWRNLVIKTIDTIAVKIAWRATNLGKNRWAIGNRITGNELYYLNADSLIQVSDFWKGPSDGLDLEQVHSNYTPGYSFVGDTLFFVSSKGTNGKWYLSYQVGKQKAIQQMFSIPSNKGENRWDIGSLYATSKGCFIEHSYAPDLRGGAVVFYPFNLKQEFQPDTIELKAGEWVRGFGEVKETWNNNGRINLDDMVMNRKGDIFFSIETDLNLRTMDYHKLSLFPNRGTNIIVKLDSNGNKHWDYSFGYYTIAGNLRLAALGEKDLVVAGCARMGAIIGTDTLKVPVSNYLIRLNGETGRPVWAKSFFSKWSLTAPENIEALTCDAQGNVYLVVKLRGSSFILENTSMQLTRQGAHVLVKFNESGALLWATELPVEWNRNYTGKTVKVLLDEARKQIICLTTEAAYYNTWSSCNFNNWNALYTSVSTTDGKVRWKKDVNFSDLGGMLTLALNERGFLVSTGYYRGSFNFNGNRMITPQGEFCNEMRSLRLLMDPMNGEYQYATWNPQSHFLPFRSTQHNNQVWEIGSYRKTLEENRYDLLLSASDFNGRFLKEIPLVKETDPTDFEVNAFIECLNGYVYIADYASPQFGPIYNNHPFHNAVNILKLRLPEVPIYSENYDAQSLERKLLIGPNPIISDLQLGYPEPGAYNLLEVYDLSGKLVTMRNLQTQVNYETLSLPNLLPGLYLFRFSGSAGALTLRMLKD
jgi:hypothetical protein